MTFLEKPRIFGTGFISLDLVLGYDPEAIVRSWAGGTCGNVLSILAFLGWEAFPIARMNNDQASNRVRVDLAQCGMHLDFISCTPTANTPIVIQEIKCGKDGKPKHRFSWSCRKCGKWLPPYRPVTTASVEIVTPAMTDVSVFFFDRLSRAALSLAEEASNQGAVVVFEPSSKGDARLMNEAVNLAHIVKYADQRLAGVDGTMNDRSATIIEIQTLGEQGLRYRHRFQRSPSDWMHLRAISPPKLADSCGAGDWLTAGLLAKATSGGLIELVNGGARGVRHAFRYGQALAAWSCGFEGARGGMYAVARGLFNKQISALLKGQCDPIDVPISSARSEGFIDCPACPAS